MVKGFKKTAVAFLTFLVLAWGRETESTKIWREKTGKGTQGC